MVVLGIESSCDETAAAVIEGWRLRSSVIASQAELHAPFGGVVPEIASRRHVEVVTLIVEEALRQAALDLSALEGVAVTNRPGLIGSLLVGVAAAKSLALALRLPLVGVHHIEGHIFSGFAPEEAPRLPAVALVASGGHTELYFVRDLHDYAILGRRRDDAAGEALDKAARVLGLGSGGGAALEHAARGGDPKAVAFPRARTANPLDFSFSGVKTALIRHRQQAGDTLPVPDVAASFQAAIVEVLVEHTLLAVEKTGVDHVLVGGGVAANGLLQEQLKAGAERRGVKVSFPPPALCTDNAAMIAAVGQSLLTRGVRHGLELDTFAREPLTETLYEG